MKKVFYRIIFLSFLLISSRAHANNPSTQRCEESYFIVTAYYSPYPKQFFYYKGNYEAEVILNGLGKEGASGKKPFNGMVAAPKNYAFETVIILPGRGTGVVHDRGGAIIESNDLTNIPMYDRIDIRLGTGEAGLIKALLFGKRTIKGYVCKEQFLWGQRDNVGFTTHLLPYYKHFFDTTLWIQELEPGRKDQRVSSLQFYLIKLGYLKEGVEPGYYGPKTKKAVCDYQTKKKISQPNREWCGYFGVSTRQALKKDLIEEKFFGKRIYERVAESSLMASILGGITLPEARSATGHNNLIETGKSFNTTGEKSSSPRILTGKTSTGSIPQSLAIQPAPQFTYPFVKGEKYPDVIFLQKILTHEKLFSGEINGIFNKKTIDSLADFQKKFSIAKEGSSGLGFMGPGTRNLLNQRINKGIYDEIFFPKTSKPEKKEQGKVLPEIKKPYIHFDVPFSLGERSTQIGTLQKFLAEHGFYSGTINDTFSRETKNALFQFQVHHKLITLDAHPNLKGYFGPGTRKKIMDMINK